MRWRGSRSGSCSAGGAADSELEVAKRLSVPPEKELPEIDPAVISYWRDAAGLWWIYLPRAGAGVLSQHTVTEHEDGTISVTPSIKLTGHGGVRHGHLTRGQWH